MLPEATNTTYHFNEIYKEVIQDRNDSDNKDNKLVHVKHYPTYFNISKYSNALPVGFPPNEVCYIH
ncbi:beta-1,3-n-acetylglucosaminyltransferase [Schistosoma japonicum]|uniref:Beta-1,3-n-acetylglucosaminyltransferase n=1 Tax=Schistosoma japonicum TaxID=6182 RepID=A0A4Z2D6Q1_SCHJA|nr:beta-1,3-n-acetylglucosaminyltransferase [Schistosoma japonicum]